MRRETPLRADIACLSARSGGVHRTEEEGRFGGATRNGRSAVGPLRATVVWPLGCGAVLRVGDVVAPSGGVALVVNVDDRDVGHEAVRRGAVPVLLLGLEEDAVARPDDLDRLAAALAQAHALGDEDRLAVGVGVPRGPGARSEVDAARLHAVLTRRRRDRVDEDVAGEPIGRAGRGLDGVPRDLHAYLRSLREGG